MPTPLRIGLLVFVLLSLALLPGCGIPEDLNGDGIADGIQDPNAVVLRAPSRPLDQPPGGVVAPFVDASVASLDPSGDGSLPFPFIVPIVLTSPSATDEVFTTDGVDGGGAGEVSRANFSFAFGLDFFPSAFTYLRVEGAAPSARSALAQAHRGSGVVAVGNRILFASQEDLSLQSFTCPLLDGGNTATCATQLDDDAFFVGGVNATGDGRAGGYVCSRASGACTPSAGFDPSYSFGDGVTASAPASVAAGNLRTSFVSNSVILAGTAAKGVYRSTDSGRTFVRVTSGLPSFLAVTRFAAAGSAVVAATGSGLYRSTDQGASFTKITAGLPAGAVADVRAAGAALYAAVNTATPGVFKSTDSGQTWQATGSGLAATRINSLASNANGIFAATNGGLFKSGDGGASWRAYGKGLTVSNHLAMLVSENTVFTGTFANASGVLRSADNGLTWGAPGGPLGFKIIRALWASGSVVLASGENGLYKSTDGGLSFAAIAPASVGLPTSGAYLNSFVTAGNAVLGLLNTGGVFRSTNLGDTWTASSLGLPAGVAGASLAANGNTVVMGSSSALYRSLDGGATWSAATPPTSATPYSVYALLFSGGTLYAGTYGFGAPDTHGLFRSNDAGTTWTRLSNGIPSNTPVYALAAADGRIFAGLRRGLFASSDGGDSFQVFERRLATKSIFALAAGPAGPRAPAGATRLYVGTGTGGLYIPLVPPLAQRLVPIVLDVDNGSGAHYTTELALTNRGSRPAAVTYRYTASIGSGSGIATDSLAAGQQLIVPDAIAALRAKGVPIPPGNAGGTLLVTFDGLAEAEAVSVTARTTTATGAPQPAGAAGLAYAALDHSRSPTGKQTLYGLRSSASDRSNAAVFNMGSAPVTLRVTAWSGDGSGASAVIETVTLPSFGWKQYTRILEGPGYATGWVTIERVGTTGAFGSYAVINDNGTSDGSFVLPADDLPRPQFLNVPVLVESSSFVSELVLTNASAKNATFVLTYAGGAGGTANVAVPARTQLIFPGAIAELRSRGIAVGPAGAATYAGALHVFVQGAPVNETFAGARTASPSPAAGQFGLFTPAFAAGAEANEAAWIYGLRADANNRSNVAFVNTGATPGAGSVTLQVQAYDGDAVGAAAGAPDTVTLGPGQWSQLSGFLASKGVRNGWVRITRTAGSAPWIAYGVVNDGGGPGQRTGDGAYVPMSR